MITSFRSDVAVRAFGHFRCPPHQLLRRSVVADISRQISLRPPRICRRARPLTTHPLFCGCSVPSLVQTLRYEAEREGTAGRTRARFGRFLDAERRFERTIPQKILE